MVPQRRPAWSQFFNAECAVVVHSRPTLKRTVLLAHRTKQRLRIAVVACAAYALLAAAVAAVFPREGLGFLPSFGWWLCAIPIGLIAYVALELFGSWSFGLPFWQRMPSSARVLLLVALISGIAVGAFFISQFVSHHGSL